MITITKSQKEELTNKYKNKKIRINEMVGEPHYINREGVVNFVDDIGNLFGTWGSLAIIPEEDNFEIIE